MLILKYIIIWFCIALCGNGLLIYAIESIITLPWYVEAIEGAVVGWFGTNYIIAAYMQESEHGTH